MYAHPPPGGVSTTTPSLPGGAIICNIFSDLDDDEVSSFRLSNNDSSNNGKFFLELDDDDVPDCKYLSSPGSFFLPDSKSSLIELVEPLNCFILDCGPFPTGSPEFSCLPRLRYIISTPAATSMAMTHTVPNAAPMAVPFPPPPSSLLLLSSSEPTVVPESFPSPSSLPGPLLPFSFPGKGICRTPLTDVTPS